MSLYGQKMLREGVLTEADIESMDPTPFMEGFLYDDMLRANNYQRQAFINSEAATVLQEKQVLNKKTMMRLSKQDDQKRRVKLVAYQLARSGDDQNWKKMVFYRQKWKEHRDKVLKKYGKKAQAIAKVMQKKYIAMAKKLPNHAPKDTKK